MGNPGNFENTPQGLRRLTKLLQWHKTGDDFVHGTLSHCSSLRHLSIFATARVAYAARRMAGIVLLLGMTGTVFGGTGAEALADSSDRALLLRRAQGGDARAAFTLGMRYASPDYSGQGDVEAVRWLRLAAEQGHAEAQYNLGILYAQGRGDPGDPLQAADWYRQAAEQGHTDAQYSLGVLYDLGRGVTADVATAMQWYELAAAGGYHPAASRLEALRADNPELVVETSMPSPSAATQAAPQGPHAAPMASTQPGSSDSQTHSAAPAAAPAATSPAPSTVELAAAAQPMGPGSRSASPWLASLDPDHYTLQLMSHRNEASVQRYLAENFGDGEAGYFVFERDGKTWYTLVFGEYTSLSQATRAGASLAGRLRELEPWVRRIAVIQKAAIR